MRSLPVTHTHTQYERIHTEKAPRDFYYSIMSFRRGCRSVLVIYFGVITLLSDGCSRFVSHHVTPRRLGFALLATAFGGAGNYSRLAVCCRRSRN